MDGEGPPLPPHLRTVKLSTVIHRLVEKTYLELSSLSESLQDKPDQIRKTALRDFFQRSRYSFLRLLVLVKWAKHVPAVKKCWEILDFLQEQDNSLRDAADGLFWLTNTLRGARTPNYDVPTAIDILTTGSYQRLPTAITDLVPPPPINTFEEEAILERLNDAINMRLFTATIPPQFSIRVANGRAYCRVENEFEVVLTLYGEEKNFVKEGETKEGQSPLPWRVLGLELFIASEVKGDGEVDLLGATAIPPERIPDLLELLQRRMAVAPHPLAELYTIMHSVCVPLQVDILNVQAQALAKKRPDLKVEYVPDKELKISYWRNLVGHQQQQQQPPGQPKQLLEPASVQVVVLDEGKRLAIQHSPVLFDPETDHPVKLTVRPTNLDIGSLLQQAVAYHSRILLHKLYALLINNPAVHIPSENISLSRREPASNQGSGQSFLRIRLFESQSVSISVDLLTGKYVLLKSATPTNDEAFLRTAETRLNKDHSEIGGIVRELMRKAMQEYFCRLATNPSLGLEPFHHLMVAVSPPPAPAKVKEEGGEGPASDAKEELSSTTLSPPPPPQLSQHTVHLCFREAPDFYLSVEIAEQQDDFCPKFYLLVTKKDSASKALVQLQQVLPLEGSLLEHSFRKSAFDSSFHSRMYVCHDTKDKGKEKEKEKDQDAIMEDRAVISKRKFQETSSGSSNQARGETFKRPKVEGQLWNRAYHSILTQLVLLCRKRIASLTIRRLFDESKGIEYKIEDNGEIQFSIPCDTVMNISGMKIRFHENFEWEVLVMESHPTFSFLEVVHHTPQNVNAHIHYEKGTGWTFSYRTVHNESLKTFLRDLRGVSRMTILAKQLEEVLGPTSRHTHLQKYYSVQYFSPTYISLFFENQTRTLSILWTPEQNFVLSFGGFAFQNAHYFEFMLNTQRNMKELLEAVYCGHRPLQIIDAFLHPNSETGMYNDFEQFQRPLEILPNDFTVIPRSPSQVRLIFSNICGVDIRFLPNQLVQIDDAAMVLFQSPPSTMSLNRRQQLLPLNHYANFFTRHIVPLVLASSPTSEVIPQGRVTHAALPETLNLLHRFMGVLYFYRQAGPLLKAEMVDVKPEQHNNGIRFTINKMTFVICITDYCNLEMQSKENKEGESPALFGEGEDTHSKSLHRSDIPMLTAFFKQHVASPPYRYRINCFTSFIRILSLPPSVLSEFVQLMSKNDKMQICLLIPEGHFLAAPDSHGTPPGAGSPAVFLHKSPPTIYFLLRYQCRSTAWGHVGLRYQYAQLNAGENPFSLWPTTYASTESGALFASLMSSKTGTNLDTIIHTLEGLSEEDLTKLSAF